MSVIMPIGRPHGRQALFVKESDFGRLQDSEILNPKELISAPEKPRRREAGLGELFV